ncbi:MAG: FAD-dependent oxidoreductase [Actinobacteria bacterium]|nr:FAD-dependent oxidoreductase [Actinomycetota bacterium]
MGMEFFGEYDVVVVGAGIAGVVASISAAREGARTLLLEGSNSLGGMATAGRMTKPTGVVEGGILKEFLDRAASYGGADPELRRSYWGGYSGVFDAEVMQRVIVDALEETGVEILLHARAAQVVAHGSRLRGLVIQTKSGTKLVMAKTLVDASGDGDVAAMAGADFELGRPEDGLTQPITSYFRVLNVNVVALVQDCEENMNDMSELVVPEKGAATNGDYAMTVFVTGFSQRIEQAKRDGFRWIVPKNHITMKAGLIPGEMNINATRFHGNGLDDRTLSRAEVEIRKQAYCAFDFLKRYVRGFENAVFLEVAPRLGVRETRRITGEYVLTEYDVLHEARFGDSIGLSNCPIDIHEPGGENGTMIGTGSGYGMPYRCLLPLRVDGLLTCGRCISVDATAFGSTRNIPACAITGEAAGVAAAIAAKGGVSPREIAVAEIQGRLRSRGIPLGTPETAASG